ncbi:optineurin isoform X3 [Manduca sexta]|uniref:optineurin isoform X3 n=1 Tax=Manduca sexta TaxID=7130 RepID=UPI00188E9311|nr:optineurin isoform X3 [Manduca sexta]
MTSKLENSDDESFIILDQSPGSSLGMKCDSLENGGCRIDKEHLQEAIEDLPGEVNLAFKAHFKIDDCPSPASMMVASTIVTDEGSTEELQKRFAEILDENVILKSSLQQNNDSMKQQFMLIKSCQEDMMKTHLMHKEKFEETKELIERLRQENKKLKQDVSRLMEKEALANNESGDQVKSGPPSAVEFVASPDDDTINKLTAQLELVEKQRRQVIVDNEKLTWQKESLEHIVDATSKERDDIKEKLKDLELQMSNKESEYNMEIDKLKCHIQDLQNQLDAVSNTTYMSTEQISQRDSTIQQLEAKVASLQTNLKNAQLKIMEMENVKLEYSKYKSEVAKTVKTYKDQVQEMHTRLTEATTTMFQPVSLSLGSETDSTGSNNLKIYNRTLKHLSDLLNKLTHGLSDSLVETLGASASLCDLKLDNTSVDQFKAGLDEIKQQLERQHSDALGNIGQVRGTLSIFEGIFKDYNNLVDKLNQQQPRAPSSDAAMLSAALAARDKELRALQLQLHTLRGQKEDVELLRAQIDVYKNDFEEEREARERIAAEKDNILADLQGLQRRNQDLMKELQEIRKASRPASAVSTSGAGASRVATENRDVPKKKKICTNKEQNY